MEEFQYLVRSFLLWVNKMRRQISPFGERKPLFNGIQNETKKYIFVYEGSCTEVQYFKGIIDHRSEIGIDPLIQLIPLLRNYSCETHSHPKKVFEYVNNHLEHIDTGRTILDNVIDFYFEESRSIEQRPKQLYNELEQYLSLKFDLDQCVTDLNEFIKLIVEFIENKYNIQYKINELNEYINSQNILYDKDIDVVCIIIDRNIRNMQTQDEYGKFLNNCNEKGYKLFVSNPDFELWLLMHSDKIFDYNKDDLLKNEYINKTKRFLEKELSQVFSGYKKDKTNFQKFLPFIGNAIENEKKFCENIQQLESQLGSNIGLLLQELIDRKT